MIATTDARWHGTDQSLTIKAGDDRPYPEAVLYADGDPLALDDAPPYRRIVFRVWERRGDPVIEDERAEVVDAAAGRVRYQLRRGGLPPGVYAADFRIIWQDGEVLSFPNDHSLSLTVHGR